VHLCPVLSALPYYGMPSRQCLQLAQYGIIISPCGAIGWLALNCTHTAVNKQEPAACVCMHPIGHDHFIPDDSHHAPSPTHPFTLCVCVWWGVQDPVQGQGLMVPRLTQHGMVTYPLEHGSLWVQKECSTATMPRDAVSGHLSSGVRGRILPLILG